MMTSEPVLDGAASPANGLSGAADGISVECVEGAVPPYAEASLAELYGNLFSTLAHRRVYGQSAKLNTYVARQGGRVVALWLYERRGAQIRVLNEGIELREAEIERFAACMFARYPEAAAIRWHAVRPHVQRLSRPYQRYNCLEDLVLSLPASGADYLAQLGKSTRAYIHRYLNKLRRDFPGVRFELIEANDIDPKLVQSIIDLNRARMAHKGKVSINDATLAEQIAHLAMDCGVIGALTIDGRLVAGTINYQVRDNYFLEVIAHDPAFNAYRLGTLCCYLTVCECIARGGNEYHFLWGEDEYKTRLLGRRRDLDALVVYRSRLRMLLCAGMVLTHLRCGWERRARLQLRAWRNGGGWTARALRMLGEWRHPR